MIHPHDIIYILGVPVGWQKLVYRQRRQQPSSEPSGEPSGGEETEVVQAAEHLLPHIYPALQLALLAHLQRTIHTQVGLVALAALQAVAQASSVSSAAQASMTDSDAEFSAPLPVPIAR